MIRIQVVLATFWVAVVFTQPVAARETSNCACPKEGRWKVQNLEGYMNCTGPFNMKRKLKPVKDIGTIWVLEKDCSSVFAEASRKKDEDGLMERVEDCGFAGTIEGEEEDIEMVIDITWTLDGDEFIAGEMSSETSQMGITCEYYRPFELRFDEALSAQEYAKLKPKMEKKLAKVLERKNKKKQE